MSSTEYECEECGSTFESPLKLGRHKRRETQRVSTESLLDDLSAVRAELGYTPTREEYEEHGEYSSATISQRVESWDMAAEKAGIEPRNSKVHPDEKLITVLEELAENLERTPTVDDLRNRTDHSVGTYQDRFGSWESALRAADLTPNRQSPEVVECSHCGSELRRKVGVIESNEHFFCDDSCMGEWESDNYSGEGNPRYTKQEVECAYCGETLLRARWALEENDRHYCDPSCRGAYVSESGMLSGENSPVWKGGSPGSYGPDWDEQREKALNRDGHECQSCGMTAAESQQTFGCDLHVHHRIRYEDFDSDERAHRLSNLVTLCRSCHMKWEHMPVQIDVS